MKTIAKPNLNGPRFRKTYMSILNVATFKAFKEKYPEYKELTFAEFKKIIMTFNANICNGIIENRNGMELPDGLGFLFIGTCPAAKKSTIDFKASIDSGMTVMHKNWDSDNHLMKIFYTNRPTKYPFSNKQVWAFTCVKQFKKKASEAYRENFTKYIEVSPYKKISTMFDRYRKKQYVRNLKPVIPEGYDEFKL